MNNVVKVPGMFGEPADPLNSAKSPLSKLMGAIGADTLSDHRFSAKVNDTILGK